MDAICIVLKSSKKPSSYLCCFPCLITMNKLFFSKQKNKKFESERERVEHHVCCLACHKYIFICFWAFLSLSFNSFCPYDCLFSSHTKPYTNLCVYDTSVKINTYQILKSLFCLCHCLDYDSLSLSQLCRNSSSMKLALTTSAAPKHLFQINYLI